MTTKKKTKKPTKTKKPSKIEGPISKYEESLAGALKQILETPHEEGKHLAMEFTNPGIKNGGEQFSIFVFRANPKKEVGTDFMYHCIHRLLMENAIHA